MNRALAVGGLVLLLVAGGLAWLGVREPGTPPVSPLPTVAPPPKAPWPEATLQPVAPGLKQAVLRPGAGATPSPGDLVTVTYTSWVASVETLAETVESERFLLGQGELMAGIERALGSMRVGEIRLLEVGPDLAYGQTGRPPVIPRDATLMVSLSLLGTAPAPVVPQSPPTAATDQVDEGVRYVILTPGRGQPPATGAKVELHVTTWLEDGTRVHSTLEQRRPIEVTVGKGEMMPGIERAVATMLPGERRKVVVPPELAAGPDGRGPFPPGATVVYEVERVDGAQVE